MEEFVRRSAPEVLTLTKALCAIQAPLNGEGARAAFVLDWCGERGLHAEQDDAGNVVIRTGENPETLFLAHLDTVFPPDTLLEWREEGDRIFCPGIGDDTVHVALLLYTALYAAERGLPLLFSANVGEEGEGNLRGCKALMETYGKTLKAVVAFDSYQEKMNTTAVGSERYRISADTAGGHSYRDFGSPNAIAVLGRLIAELDAQPAAPLSTYNFGTVSGGTSVNTIASHAELLYEFRSESAPSLALMRERMEAVTGKYPVRTETIGVRPCGDVPAEKQEALAKKAEAAFLRAGLPAPARQPGSTDCNLPLSKGIPAVCVGLVRGGGAHTLREYILPESVPAGLAVALHLAESFR